MKWNSNQIISFLNIYEKYDVLWDIRNKEHMNQLKRGSAFDRLLKELKEIEGFENTDLTIMKTKLKTIKTVYRQELNKIANSKKSGSGTDDIYKPKLIWFANADAFLKNVTITRHTTNNMNTQEIVAQENETATTESSCNESVPKTVNSKPFQNLKRKRCSKAAPSSNIETAIHTLKEIVDKNEGNVEDEYDIFGKLIAAQLRQLPITSSVIVQGRIQQLITTERLDHLSSNNNSVLQTPSGNNQQEYFQLSESRPSTSCSNYSQVQYSDIIHQALSDVDYDDV